MDTFLLDLLGNQILAGVVAAALVLVFVLLFALVAIYAELKLAAFMQHRLGPMEAGPHGVLQPFAEILKLLQKEAIRPDRADRWLFQMAPFLVFVGCFAAFAVVPFSPLYIGADIDVGVYYIIAVSSLVVIGIFMGGWASNNKYTLYGGVRSVAQIISYEIPAGFIVLAIVMMSGTLSMQGIIEQQGGGFWNWYVFGGPKSGSTTSMITGGMISTPGTAASFLLMPLMAIALLILYSSGLAETNRVPFDLPEAESELVGGYNTEYSAMKYAIFFLAEYGNMFVVCAIATTLFLGGWQPPLPRFFAQYAGLGSPFWIGIEGFFWFVAKSMVLVLMQIMLRWTLPRLRADQLMHLSWKMFLPIGFVVVIVIGAWITFIGAPNADPRQALSPAAAPVQVGVASAPAPVPSATIHNGGVRQ
jgi:NADH-quinone oxidoreductase subunit H